MYKYREPLERPWVCLSLVNWLRQMNRTIKYVCVCVSHTQTLNKKCTNQRWFRMKMRESLKNNQTCSCVS